MSGRKPAANNSAEENAAKIPVSLDDLHDTLELGRCDDRYSSNDTDKDKKPMTMTNKKKAHRRPEQHAAPETTNPPAPLTSNPVNIHILYYEVTFTAPKLGLCLTQRPGEQHVVVTKSAGSSHEAGVQEGDLLLAVAGQHIPKLEQGMQAAAQSMIDGAARPLLMRFKRLAESTSGEADGNSHVMNVAPKQVVSNRNTRHLVASNPVTIDEIETRLSKMTAAVDEHGGVSRDLAESTSGEADGNSRVMNVSPEQVVSNRNRRHLVASSNPVNIDEIATRLSKMIAAVDEHGGVSQDLAENDEELTSSNVAFVVTQCDI
jgi:hypothetical protein